VVLQVKIKSIGLSTCKNMKADGTSSKGTWQENLDGGQSE